MAMVRRIHKAKRLRLKKHRQVGTLNDGRHKPHEYEQRGETLRLFKDACQVKVVAQPTIEVEQAYCKPVTDYISLAIKAAKALNEKTTLNSIDKVAKGLFKFDVISQLNKCMPDVVSQEIYDWIVTLSEQPIDEEEKLRLARKFIVSLAPVSSPVEKTGSIIR
jgi:hypothetical protein